MTLLLPSALLQGAGSAGCRLGLGRSDGTSGGQIALFDPLTTLGTTGSHAAAAAAVITGRKKRFMEILPVRPGRSWKIVGKSLTLLPGSRKENLNAF